MKKRFQGPPGNPPGQSQQPYAISQAADGCGDGVQQGPGSAQGIGQGIQPPPDANHGAGRKGSQFKSPVVQCPPGLRVGGLQNLESTIQAEAALKVSANAPTEPAAGLEYPDGDSPGMQVPGTSQPADAPTDDNDRFVSRSHCPLLIMHCRSFLFDHKSRSPPGQADRVSTSQTGPCQTSRSRSDNFIYPV